MRLRMNNVSISATFALLAPLATLGALLPVRADAAPADKDQVRRGEYLGRIAGCNDCHTPLKMGPKGPDPAMTPA